MDAEQKGLWDWLFGESKPDGPKIPDKSEMAGGHRGVAAGRLKPGEQDLSAENIANWEQLTGDEVEDFVVGGQVMQVHSTNVAWMQYDIKKQQLLVAFKPRKSKPETVYEYSQISPQEAIRMAKAQSKGGATWDYLIGRGKRGGAGGLKPYRKIR